MAGRNVGAGRGAVFAGGVRYDEGAEIPKDVEVGEHVFTDVDEPVGNVPAGPNAASGAALSSGNAEQAAAHAERDAAAVTNELTVTEALAEAGVDVEQPEESGRKSSRK